VEPSRYPFDTFSQISSEIQQHGVSEKLICNWANALLLKSEVMHFCFLEEIHSDLVNLSRE